MEKVLRVPACPRAPLKTTTLQYRCTRKGKVFVLHATLSRHPVVFPPVAGSLAGFVSGELTLHTRSPQAASWQDFLSAASDVRGHIELHDLTSPFFRDLADIHLNFSEGAPRETLVTGSIGSIHKFFGSGIDGAWKVQLAFTGLQMERHLPSFWGLFPLSLTGVVQFNFPQPALPVIRVHGFLAFLPPLFAGRAGAIIRNREPLEAVFEPQGLRIRSAILDVSGNEVRVEGSLSPSRMDIAVQGEPDARRLQFLYPALIASVEGISRLRATISGSPLDPRVEGFLHMGEATVAFGPQQTRMRLSTLNLQATSRWLQVAFSLFGQDAVPLSVAGRIRLLPERRFEGMRLEGVVPNEILLHMGRRIFSDIQGCWRVKAVLDGSLESPAFTGTLAGRSLDFRVRGVPEGISVPEADVRFGDNALFLNRLKLHYSGGDFALTGRVRFHPSPDFDVRISGNSVPYNVPGVFLSESNMDLRFSGPVGNTELSGKIDIVSGRYIQTYDVIQRILTVHRFRERAAPPWQPFPVLGKTRLSVALLNTGELEVGNNVANLQLDGLLSLAGTLEKPRLQGQLTVNTGTFKVPFFRGVYDVDEGSVNFDISEEPFLNIRGTTTVEDLNGDEVMVRLHLQGPLNRIDFTLSSIPEMEQGQILMLLAAGRTMEDIRSAWRGNPRDGTGISSGGFNPLDYYDESIKQVTGDFLSMLVANPIRMVTRLDLFRMELGSDSFQVSAAKTFLRHITMKGEVEVGFLGRNRQEGGLEIKLFDNLRLYGTLRRSLPDYNQYEYEEPLKGRVELRYRMKFRGDLRDVIGFW